MGNLTASIVLELLDHVSRPMDRISRKLTQTTRPVRDLRAAFKSLAKASGLDRLRRSAVRLKDSLKGVVAGAKASALRVGGFLAGTAFGFKRLFIDPAAAFEDMLATLETVEGDAGKARRAFEWVSDFATKTPFQLAGVTEAFVRLRAYGIDPIKNDALRVLGDTASAMSKDVMMAVEAIADATTGEFERLKEFGVKARQLGKQSVFEYTDAQGKQRRVAFDRNNRAMIQSTLLAIWNEKYAGAMDKRSKNWNGLVSNLLDQWTRFVRMVMGSGVFDLLKGELKSLLDTVNRMAASGELKKLATKLSDSFKSAFHAIKDFVPRFVTEVRSLWDSLRPVVDFLGGPAKAAALGLAAVLLGPLIGSLAMFAASLVSMGVSLAGFALNIGMATGATAGFGATMAAAMVPAAAFLAMLGSIALAYSRISDAASNLYDNPKFSFWKDLKSTFGFDSYGLDPVGDPLRLGRNGGNREFGRGYMQVEITGDKADNARITQVRGGENLDIEAQLAGRNLGGLV